MPPVSGFLYNRVTFVLGCAIIRKSRGKRERTMIRTVKSECSIDYNAQQRAAEILGIRRIEPPKLCFNKSADDYSVSWPECYDKWPSLKDLWSFSLKTSNVGRVVAIEVRYNVRIMSDVWSDMVDAIIYDDETGKFSRKVLGERDSGSNNDIYYNVDAPDYLIEAYQAGLAGRALAKSMREYDREFWDRRVQQAKVWKGDTVRVVKGRKVKVGTEGIVFWMGDCQWGTKVGIAVPEEDGTYAKEIRRGRGGRDYESYANVRWTSLDNVKKITMLGGSVIDPYRDTCRM